MNIIAKLIGFITLIISLLAIGLGFLWLQDKSSQEVQFNVEQTDKQISALLHQASLRRLNALESQVTAIAKSTEIYSLLMLNNDDDIRLKQQQLTALFPDAISVCLVAAEVDDIAANSCTPITFSILNSLRQAKKMGLAPIGLMKKEKEDAHVLVAHRVMNKHEHIAGVLLLLLKPQVIDSLFLDLTDDFQGYIELQQGHKKSVILASRGNINNKVGEGSFIHPLPNTYWTLAYWSKHKTPLEPSYIEIAIVLSIVFLMWLLRGGFLSYLLKRDSGILLTQITDLKANVLKLKYPLFFSELETVESEIKVLSLDALSEVKVKKGATADSINKKIKEKERDDAAEEFDVLQNSTRVAQSLFKANDIRGIADLDLDVDTVTLIGRAVGSEVIEKGQDTLIVGRDGRLSSESLSEALIEGVLASGCNVIDIGELPTPTFYFACQKMNISSGVMVTGSHNPSEYNGLKISLAGRTVFGEQLQDIYHRIQNDSLLSGEGTRARGDVTKNYIAQIVQDINLARPMKIVIDCGNGIAGMVAPLLFKELGCDVIALYCNVDGHFPNHQPNPSDPRNLQDLAAVVKDQGAELGLAFDGDGDRLGVVDAHGNPVWPDRLMMLFAQDILSKKPGSSIVYDVKCSSLLASEITVNGGVPHMVKSGYAFIKDKMQEIDAPLAGELSGHIFFNDRWYGFDDGLYAASRLLELITNDAPQRRASEVLLALPNRESTAEIFVKLEDSDEAPKIIEKLMMEQFDGGELITIDGVRVEYSHGWGLVRSSNTMPGLSLRFEANTQEELLSIQQIFKQKLFQISPILTLPF